MDEWIAFRHIRCDPFDRIAEILKRGFVMLAAAQGVKVDEDMQNSLDPQLDLEDREADEMSPDQGVKVLSSMLGKPNGNTSR